MIRSIKMTLRGAVLGAVLTALVGANTGCDDVTSSAAGLRSDGPSVADRKVAQTAWWWWIPPPRRP